MVLINPLTLHLNRSAKHAWIYVVLTRFIPSEIDQAVGSTKQKRKTKTGKGKKKEKEKRSQIYESLQIDT
jgi:hypothetical protein